MDSHFDDLTRALGAPLPRRRALALIGASVLGAALRLRPRPASAGHCATERTCKMHQEKLICVRPFGGDTNPSQDCKCAPDAKEGDGCIQARPHCGSSDNPC